MANPGDKSASTDSESGHSPFRSFSSPPSATDSGSLHPASVHRISSNPSQLLSPSDLVGPSPVTSNGTETTEIEDDVDDLRSPQEIDPTLQSEPLMLATALPDSVRLRGPGESDSVIHAPESFRSWTSTESTARPSQSSQKSSPKMNNSRPNSLPSSPPNHHQELPPVQTDVKPVRYSVDSATPRAQDLQDMINESNRLRSSSTSSLEKIEEQTEAEGDDDDDLFSDGERLFSKAQLRGSRTEVERLRLLFSAAWTCCLEFGSYNSRRRRRDYSSPGPDNHVQAWQLCWKLCEQLHNDEMSNTKALRVRENLELCRTFFHALFDIRQKTDELADSNLRCSVELAKHLYSGQDLDNLPDEFQERTLDFYVIACHRLMKQRNLINGESDRVLKACWELTEVLFSIRQNRRDGYSTDENLLVAAIEATYNLNDLFREGLSASRSERNTPRPSQTNFYHSPEQTGRESRSSNHSSRSRKESGSRASYREERPPKPPPVPETPVTEFEDTPISPESRSPQMPNIMVLGPSSDGGHGSRWPSNSSSISSYSRGSNRTSSTATTTTATEDVNVTRAKVLVLHAAVQVGFNKEKIIDVKTGATAFQNFVSGLQPGAFGSLATHATLLQQYRESILKDGFVPRGSFVLSSRTKRVPAQDLAKSVQIMISSSPSRYGYFRELFKFVCGFPLEEADSRRNFMIEV